MRSSEHVDELSKALAAFQAAPVSVNKSHTAKVQMKSGGEFSYKYADLADTVAAAAPRAAEFGLSVTQMPDWEGGHMDTLTTRLCHVSGQWIESTMRLFLRGEDPQSHGSAITYARRYAYCAALGIVADEDDDGAAATHVNQPSEPRRQEQHSTVRPAPAAQASIAEHYVGTIHPVFGACKQCGGNEFYDNRAKKASGEYKQNAADGKCKNKSCAKAVWLPKGDGAARAAQQAETKVVEAFGGTYDEEPF